VTASSASQPQLTERDLRGLLFTAEMYGLQLDLLAGLLGLTQERVRPVVARWRKLGYAEAARIGPGRSWVWLTRRGLTACGLRYTAVPPALSRLAHLRATAVVRLALESAGGYQRAQAYWRGERRLRARMGGRVGMREHVPDGEIHFPYGSGSDYQGGTPQTRDLVALPTQKIPHSPFPANSPCPFPALPGLICALSLPITQNPGLRQAHKCSKCHTSHSRYFTVPVRSLYAGHVAYCWLTIPG
jgi:hypothetical protein